jgi:hypothetical protein
MALLIVAIGLTLFVVLCVITLFGSRWIYKPILKIYRLMKSDNPDEMRAIFDSIRTR